MSGQQTLGPDFADVPYSLTARDGAAELCVEPGCGRQDYLDGLCKRHRDIAMYRAETARRRTADGIAACPP